MKGMGCGGTISVLLGVAFVILKVIGAINWEWGWVLAPFWVYGIVLIISSLAYFFYVLWIKKL